MLRCLCRCFVVQSPLFSYLFPPLEVIFGLTRAPLSLSLSLSPPLGLAVAVSVSVTLLSLPLSFVLLPSPPLFLHPPNDVVRAVQVRREQGRQSVRVPVAAPHLLPPRRAATSRSSGTVSALLSSVPPHTRRVTCHSKCPCVSRAGCYGWLLWVVAMGGCYGWMLLGAHAYRVLVGACTPMLCRMAGD